MSSSCGSHGSLILHTSLSDSEINEIQKWGEIMKMITDSKAISSCVKKVNDSKIRNRILIINNRGLYVY